MVFIHGSGIPGYCWKSGRQRKATDCPQGELNCPDAVSLHPEQGELNCPELESSQHAVTSYFDINAQKLKRVKVKDTDWSKRTWNAVHVFSGPRRPDDWHEEVLNTAKQLGATLHAEDYDLEIASGHDLLKDAFYRKLLRRCREGKVQIILGGPPCATWSAARNLGPPGPPPVRDRHHLYGLPGLSRSLAQQVLVANTLLERWVALCYAVSGSGGYWLLEHPKDRGCSPFPSIWLTDLVKDLIFHTGGTKLDVDQCRFGAESRKSTTLAGTAPDLSLLARLGTSLSCRCTRPHPKQLYGLNKEGKFRTSAAQSYPGPFCRLLAKCFLLGAGSLNNTTEVIFPDGSIREPPGLTLHWNLQEARVTKGGNYREPDFVVADKLAHWNWKSIFAIKVEQEAHINLNELRAAKHWIRRYAQRGPTGKGTRLLLLLDSRVVVGGLARGRSGSPLLNKHLKTLLPMYLGSNLYVAPLWLPTGSNPADCPSRFSSLASWLKEARRDARKRRGPQGPRQTKG